MSMVKENKAAPLPEKHHPTDGSLSSLTKLNFISKISLALLLTKRK
jgi:hypothetical protein